MVVQATHPSTDPDPVEGKETMSRKLGHTITVAAFLVPAAILGGVGLWVGSIYTALGLAVLWICILFGVSVAFRRVRTYAVVERFGLFWDIKFAGLRLLIPLIDNIVLDDNFLQKEVPMFLDETVDADGKKKVEIIEIDFRAEQTPDGGTSAGGASAPLKTAAWYQVGNPDDVKHGRWPEVRKQVFRYTYTVTADQRASRVAEIFQNAFRQLLESTSLSTAQSTMVDIANKAATEASEALAQIGVYPFPGKGITVRDIVLPPALIALRERALSGQIDAEQAINLSKKFWQPVVLMKDGLKKAGVSIDDEQIQTLYLMQLAIDMLSKTGSNLSFFSEDVDGVLKTISVTPTGRTPRAVPQPGT